MSLIRVFFPGVAAAALLLSGCAGPAEGPEPGARAAGGPVTIPARPAPTAHIFSRSRMFAIGSVPWDMQTLPLVSPDGRYIATQHGVAPTVATMDARSDATVPLATRVSVYTLERPSPGTSGTPGTTGETDLPLVASLDQPLMLGRSAQGAGFTVEAPQPDGSRWVGFVHWESGSLDWLVQDDAVNAFAAIGPDGRLAWSRRAINEDRFHLVVHHGESEFTIDDGVSHWLMPTWTESGEGLFALKLSPEGDLSAVYLQGSTEVAMLQSMREIRLAVGADVGAAVQMLAAQPSVIGDPQPAQPQFVFFHPRLTYLRMALWRPLAGRSSTVLLPEKSMAAAIDPSNFVFVSTMDELLGYPLDQPDAQIVFSNRPMVPRLTHSDDWPVVLLQPKEGVSRIDVIGMQAVALQ